MKIPLIYISLAISSLCLSSTTLLASNLKDNVLDIVKNCDNKYAGEDQSTIFSVSVKNKRGREQKSIYQRFWQNNGDDEAIVDKLSLFTLSPADAKNTAFLQLSFNPNQDKNADQWVYLPSLRKIRRTTIQNLSDSFLGTDLTFDDIRLREITEDKHKILGIKESKTSVYYTIESRPKETTSMYGRKIVVYEENKHSGACLKKEITYFDKNNGTIKKQTLSWQKIGKAWLWDTVVVKNAQTFGSSTFKISRAKVNTGISDKWFTTRMLERGLR